MAKLPGSFAVIGDVQWLPGYCVLLADDPATDRLSDLPRDKQRQYLHSMATLAEAVEGACRDADPSFRRVNIEILGNTDAFLHTHIWPRYEWEPPELVGKPVWLYPPERWQDLNTALGSDHDQLRSAVTDRLLAAGATEP